MPASDVVAASAVAVTAVTSSSPINWPTAIVTGLFGLVGSGLGSWVVLFNGKKSRDVDANKEAMRRAFDSAGSHMAIVSFDKYVQFCEAYLAQYREAMSVIFAKGPCPEAVDFQKKLSLLRVDWALWITANTGDELAQYEKIMLQMGIDARMAQSAGVAHNMSTEKFIDSMHEKFAELSGMKEWGGKTLSGISGIENMINVIRKTLGVDEMDALRRETMNLALDDLSKARRSS